MRIGVLLPLVPSGANNCTSPRALNGVVNDTDVPGADSVMTIGTAVI